MARERGGDDPWLTVPELAPRLGFSAVKTCRNRLRAAAVPHDDRHPRRYRLSVAREALGGAEAERKRQRYVQGARAAALNRKLRDVHRPARPQGIRNAAGRAAWLERGNQDDRPPPPLVGPQRGDGWHPPVALDADDYAAGRVLMAALR